MMATNSGTVAIGTVADTVTQRQRLSPGLKGLGPVQLEREEEPPEDWDLALTDKGPPISLGPDPTPAKNGKDNNQTLACVMIPMIGCQLLLPSVSLAEVVDYSPDISTSADSPAWLAGHLEWRGLRLPVISYDAASGGQLAQPNNRRGRVVVINSIVEEHREQPFIALMTQGIPSQNRINQSQIQRLDSPAGVADLMEVDVDGERAWIPNLEYLESLAQQLR